MTERWFKALNKNQVVAVLLIDFKKAFDSVSHPILMKKLSACGVTRDLHCYLKSYLTSRKQFTKLNNVLSDKTTVEYGVPQGSLIGPTGFSINVNDMADNVCNQKNGNNTEKGELNLFADDTTAHEVGNTVDDALAKIQGTANEFFDHSCRNSLSTLKSVRFSLFLVKALSVHCNK